MSNPTAEYNSMSNDPKEAMLGNGGKSLPSAVEVKAPVDLAAGYEFTVDVAGEATLVRVPDGGVKEGQIFAAQVLPQAKSSITGQHIPQGSWRDGICDFFVYGACHPMCCLAFWCVPLALGQVMTRMNFDGLGRQRAVDPEDKTSAQFWTAFKVLAVILASYIFLDQIISLWLMPYDAYIDNDEGTIANEYIPVWVAVVMIGKYLLEVSFFVYIVVLMTRTRRYIRERYAIQERCNCGGMEDCCLSFWLPFCTVTQMARHTADYSEYRAACCTDTGLPDHEVENV